MRTVVVLGWMVAFAVALGLALVTRRGAAWVSVAALALPALYVAFAIVYGTR